MAKISLKDGRFGLLSQTPGILLPVQFHHPVMGIFDAMRCGKSLKGIGIAAALPHHLDD